MGAWVLESHSVVNLKVHLDLLGCLELALLIENLIVDHLSDSLVGVHEGKELAQFSD